MNLAGGENVEARLVDHRHCSKPVQIQVRCLVCRILLGACSVLEIECLVDSVAEEDLVVNEDLLLFQVLRVHRCQGAVDDRDTALSSRAAEVSVNLGEGPVSLDALEDGRVGQLFDRLELFVPVPTKFRVDAEETCLCLLSS